jgi:hypothetical protein
MPSRSGAAHQARSSGNRHRSEADLSILEAEARYHRDRLALYRARVLSAKATSSGRLRELEQAAASAAARLHHASRG